MDLFRIECFLAAAETGNMTRAAERMNITQPAMSFQIRELEKEVQLSLFARDRNGIYLTEAGKVMQSGFRRILESYHRLLEDARASAYGKTHLTIGYHGPLGWAGILQFIGEFSAKYPEIEVAVFQQEFRELADYVEQGILDVAFIENAELVSRKQLSSTPLFSDTACFAVAPFHPLGTVPSVTPEQLAGEKILMNNHPSDSMASLTARLVRSGIRRDSFRFFDRTEITLATAAAGQGIAVIPSSFRVENSALHYVDYASDSFRMDYSIAWNTERENAPVRTFIKEALEKTWPCVRILSDR